MKRKKVRQSSSWGPVRMIRNCRPVYALDFRVFDDIELRFKPFGLKACLFNYFMEARKRVTNQLKMMAVLFFSPTTIGIFTVSRILVLGLSKNCEFSPYQGLCGYCHHQFCLANMYGSLDPPQCYELSHLTLDKIITQFFYKHIQKGHSFKN